ncbi:MAG: non-homologous end-joining DNA ligase [Thermoleophilaceae bacterium]
MAAATRVQVDVDGHRLSLSNLDKVMYPAVGFTKGQVIDYYTRVAPYVLPHLDGRPLTLKRYPNGVDGEFFYEKQCPSHRPDWVRTERIEARRKAIDFCVCDDLATLVWAANLADLELHPSLSRAEDIERPTAMAFDLDPGQPAGILECCRVGLWLRDTLAELGLQCFPKTSGSKGLQVYAPLNTPVTYDDTKPLANALARHLESQHPELVVSSMKKELRGGKVLIDWSQNDEHKTTVCVYSLRARESPTVSTPLEWDEVEAALAAEDAGALVFEAEEVLERTAERGDLFEPVVRLEQELPEL